MIKVCINTYPTAYITPGGGEIQLLQTYKWLKKIGYNVNLFNQWEPNFDDIDVVHFFSVYGGSLAFCKSVKSQGKKLIVSPVIWLDDMSKYPIGEIKAILDLADLILPNSLAEADMLFQKLGIPKEKMEVVYNAVEPSVFHNIDKDLFRKTYGLDKYILNVGNIEPRKNQKNLIKAMEGIDVPLVIIGNVRDDKYADDCRRLSIGKNIKYVGPLEHDSAMLLSAYAGAEVFALPSTLETPGLVALEAAASGCKKILITGVGSAREYFEDNAVYIDNVLDYVEINKKIKYLLDSNWNDYDIGKDIRNKFSWKKTADSTYKAYEKVITMEKINATDIMDSDIALGDGWYDLEFDGKRHFRWMQCEANFSCSTSGILYLLIGNPHKTLKLKIADNIIIDIYNGWNEYTILLSNKEYNSISLQIISSYGQLEEVRDLGLMIGKLSINNGYYYKDTVYSSKYDDDDICAYYDYIASENATKGILVLENGGNDNRDNYYIDMIFKSCTENDNEISYCIDEENGYIKKGEMQTLSISAKKVTIMRFV